MTLSFRYLVAGRIIGTDVPFPELADNPAHERDAREIAIYLDSPGGDPSAVSWEAPEPAGDESAAATLRLGTFEGGYVVAYPEGGRFVISRAGDSIRCADVCGLPGHAVRHMVLDRVLPLALGLRGDVVLHAGAVDLGDAGLALAGASGRGKSTLVAYFGIRRAGVLTDDCLVLRRHRSGWQAVPYYKGLRLWPESVAEFGFDAAPESPGAEPGDKRRIGGSALVRYGKDAVPLRMICFLGEEAAGIAEVALKPLSPREAFFALLAVSFSIGNRGHEPLQRQLQMVGRLAEEVPAFALDYPRRFHALASVEARIRSAVAEHCHAGSAA